MQPFPDSSIIVDLIFPVAQKCEQENNLDENLVETRDPQGGHKPASITNNRTSSSHYQTALQSRYVDFTLIVKYNI